MSEGTLNLPAVPEVSIVIPTRNRAPMLRDCLRAALAQSVPAEILVMNDASTDDTDAMVRHEFPAIRLFTADKSCGPTVQRNAGARRATGRYLFTLDDDCILARPDTLKQTIALFDDDRIAAVTVPFVNVLRDQILRRAAPDKNDRYVAFDYYGGMVAFRRDVFMEAGGYRESLFYYGEEADLAIRLLACGRFVRLGTADAIEHMESPVRNVTRIVRLAARNSLLHAIHNVPLPDVLWFLPGTIVRSMRASLREGNGRAGVLGVMDGLRKLPAGLRARRPVPRHVFRFVRVLRRQEPMRLEDAARALGG